MPNRWVTLLVLFIARTAMGFQFQSVASVSPLLVRDLAIDLALVAREHARTPDDDARALLERWHLELRHELAGDWVPAVQADLPELADIAEPQLAPVGELEPRQSGFDLVASPVGNASAALRWTALPDAASYTIYGARTMQIDPALASSGGPETQPTRPKRNFSMSGLQYHFE